MKQLILTSLLLILSISLCNAQDTMIFNNRDTVLVNILGMTEDKITYKHSDSLDKSIQSIEKEKVYMVVYENGTKELFNKSASLEPVQVAEKPIDDLYYSGQRDAIMFYTKHNGAGTGVLVASLVSPLLGLIPATIVSVSKPKYKNMVCPNSKLLKNREYNYGYVETVRAMKRRRVWTNWAIGLGVNIGLFAILYYN